MSQLRKTLHWVVTVVLALGALSLSHKNEPHPVAAQQDNIHYYFPLFLNTTQPPHSTSYYMITANPDFTYNLGCELGARDANLPDTQNSVMALDYSYPIDFGDGSYGAELFGFGPVSLSAIESSVESLMLGYYQCTGADSTSNLVVGIGTNNKPISTDTAEKMGAHGEAWAKMVNRVNQWAQEAHIFQQVQAFGASDIELGWNSPAMSRAWVDGYQSVAAYPYIHFGDAAGCPYKDRPDLPCGNGWTKDDVWYVAYGAAPALPMPLIYLTNGIHAEQWAYLSRYSVQTHGVPIHFSGVFTQSQACAQWGCAGADNTPEEAYRQLHGALGENPATAQRLRWKTDIRWILRAEAYPKRAASNAAPLPSREFPLADTLESLIHTLPQRNLPEKSSADLFGKVTLLENLAIEIARSALSPAPKTAQPAAVSPPIDAPIFRTGILDSCAMAGLPYGGQINNCWQTATPQGYLQMAAGTSPDDPHQGALYLLLTATDGSAAEATTILADRGSGALTIVDETSQGLWARSENDSQYLFNWETRTLLLLPH